jgi:hypothetical protein
MQFTRFFSVLCVAAVFRGTPVLATVVDDINADSHLLAKWFGEQLAGVVAFNAASAPVLPGHVLSLLGVEVGVVGGVSRSRLDVDAFRSLPLASLNNTPGTDINVPDDVLAPQVLVHMKVGLPGRFDAGFTYGGVSFSETQDDAKTDFKNTVVGAELRRRLLGGGLTGAALPDVNVSVAYTVATGRSSRGETLTNSPLGGGESLTAQTDWDTSWRTGGVTGRVTVGKPFLFITPFVGVGYTRLFGHADATVNVVGTVNNPGPVASIDTHATERASAERDVPHGVAGLELSPVPLLRVALTGVLAKDDWAANAGVRLQFR